MWIWRPTKAEFFSHYYEGRIRPRHAYAMGLIYWWARLGSLAPGLVNFVARLPVANSFLKALGGISQRRDIPAFAPETFRSWWQRRPIRNQVAPPVLLWPDTFNNHFHPQTAKAAVEVLEDAGFRVTIPHKSLCCGRPLYDFGMLTTAKGLLREILDTLRPEIEASIPIVGLEPSCVAVFRDELKNLFPMDEDAKRLSTQVFILSEFLEKKAPDYQLPTLKRKALVHKHCHHEHVMTFDAENEVLKKLGLDYELLNSGCCGMAGSFGFESSHFEISEAIGERVLLPAVRDASDDTLIIADGFSCREQIAGLTGRGALHLAQVLQMALHEGPAGPPKPLPESHYQPLGQWEPEPSALVPAMVVGAGVLLGVGIAWVLARQAGSHRRPALPWRT